MKKTAVEWLVEQLNQIGFHTILIENTIEQAKAMEKQQIIEALTTSEVELLSWGISAEKYYNQTFKKTNNESNL